MSYPKLVRQAKTPVRVRLTSTEINSFNEREVITDAEFLCNFQAGGAVAYGERKERIQLSGTALIDGDICPGYDAPACGNILVFGAEYEIVRARKWRNPDGSVNYTSLDVI